MAAFIRHVGNRVVLTSFNVSKYHSYRFFRHKQCFVHQKCSYSTPPQRKSIFSQIVDNIKQDIDKNKEMKENLKKFREETQKLEQSEALQKVKQKYKEIEEGSQQIKGQLENIKGKIKEGLEEAQKSELGRKGRELTEELSKSAKTAAEAVAKQTEQLGKSIPIKAVAEGVKAVKEQIEETTLSGPGVYKPPVKLRKRSENTRMKMEDKSFEPNTQATGLELHKDSKWFQSWQNFRENNQYVNKIFDWKVKYDESDNPVVRASRLLTDKVSDLFGGLFQKTEISEVLTEIVKMDPSFDKENFLKECEKEIIPNILEAMIRGDLEILRDWCHDGPYNTLAAPIKQVQSLGYHFDSKILDINNVDLAVGKIMDQGPVLIVTFQSQQILAVRDSKGKIIEGDPEKVLRVHYVWALCRDQDELDPKAAWKLMDLSASSTEQWL